MSVHGLHLQAVLHQDFLLIADALGSTGSLLDYFQETKSALAANRTAKVADRCVVGQVVSFWLCCWQVGKPGIKC